jgi:hypothetical protein
MIKPFTQLYNHNKNPKKSIKGTGYGSKEKALKTLSIIKKEPLVKQKQIVITMYNRAKFHKYRTEKMEYAMKVYELWMRKNNISIGKSLQYYKSKKNKNTNNKKSKDKKSKEGKSKEKNKVGSKKGHKLKDCCSISTRHTKCIRRKDNKIFNLKNRRFTKKQCIKQPIRGFSMKSSCTPYIHC